MAGTVIVPWYATGFRADALEEALNAVAAVACFWAAGKVYRVGMLLYGKLPSPRQVLAVLRS